MNKRYDFIDFAKGIGIITVIIYHIKVPFLYQVCMTYYMLPVYYICSGIFFSRYNNKKTFFLKKFNSLILPYLFFFILDFFIILLFHFKYPDLQYNELNRISGNIQNGPIWFLRSLFIVELIFYIVTYVKKQILIFLLSLLISFMGYCMSINKMILPFDIISSLTCIIFFYFGYLLRRLNILEGNKKKIVILILSITSYLGISIFLIHNRELCLENNNIPNNYVYFIIASSCGSLFILYLSKIITKIKPINYLGRYSLTILCTHWFLLRIWGYILPYHIMQLTITKYILFVYIILISFPIIYLFRKYLPWFCGIKQLM